MYFGGGFKHRIGEILFCAMLAASTPAMSQTSAGTRITNVASATFLHDGQTFKLTSNVVTTCVDEELDVSVQAQNVVAQSAAAFTLMNEGNGLESFALSTTVEGKGAVLPIWIDADGNGAFDPAIDTVRIENNISPALPAGGMIKLLVLPDGDDGADAVAVTLTARAVTGTGAAGTSFTGKGQGDCDAVVGADGGSATASGSASLGDGSPPAKIVKSQQVQAPDGSATPRSGATITYRLEIITRARAVLRGAYVTDPLPVGTEYLPGSLRLDDVALSDSDDGDPGLFDGRQIRVALGEMPASVNRAVTFQVKIR